MNTQVYTGGGGSALASRVSRACVRGSRAHARPYCALLAEGPGRGRGAGKLPIYGGNADLAGYISTWNILPGGGTGPGMVPGSTLKHWDIRQNALLCEKSAEIGRWRLCVQRKPDGLRAVASGGVKCGIGVGDRVSLPLTKYRY